MDRMLRRLASAASLALALLVSGCAGDGTVRGVLVYDGQHEIADGRVVKGDLAVPAGTVVVRPGATVEGSVWVLGGTGEVAGAVAGDVNGLAGRLIVSEGARITGSIVLAGSLADIAPGVQIQGQVSQSLSALARPRQPLEVRMLAALQQAALVATLALALGLWFAPALSRIGAAATQHPAVTLATGVLAGITGVVILVLVGFTLVLLPLAVVLGLGALLAVLVGWAGLGAWLAERLAHAWMPVPLAIALGSLVVVVAVQTGSLVPGVGAFVGLAAAC